MMEGQIALTARGSAEKLNGVVAFQRRSGARHTEAGKRGRTEGEQARGQGERKTEVHGNIPGRLS